MNMTAEQIKEKIKAFYTGNHPELQITERILSRLGNIVKDGLYKAGDGVDAETAEKAMNEFLSGKKIISFIQERQPYISPVPQGVIDSVVAYFKEELPGYSPQFIYRKSNHMEDSYLYMVAARSINGDFACWSSWNQSTLSLNHGHYNIPDEESCIEILKAQFMDISNEISKYGMEASKYDFR